MSQAGFDLWLKRSFKTLAAPWARGAARGPHNDAVLILAYHRVVADIAAAERDSIYGLVISAESFARQMEIVRARYEVLSLDDAMLVHSGTRKLTRPAAVITFDDGYRDVYDHAWPVLRRLGLPATVYVPTALLGSGQWLDHDKFYWLVLQARASGVELTPPLRAAGIVPQKAARILAFRRVAQVAEALNYQPFLVRQRLLQSLEAALREVVGEYPAGYELLSWEMVRTLADDRISFGAHTERHVVLTLEDAATSEAEIRHSKQALEAQLKRPVRHFAYPNGHHNAAVQTMVARAGFVSAVTTARTLVRRDTNTLTWGRISLCEESTRGMTGAYSNAVARMRLAI